MSRHAKRDRRGSPLPWRVSGSLVKDADNSLVAYVQYDRDRREIASAPALYDALHALVRHVGPIVDVDPDDLRHHKLRAAWDAGVAALRQASEEKQ